MLVPGSKKDMSTNRTTKPRPLSEVGESKTVMFDDIEPPLKTLTNRQSSSTFCYSLYPPSNYSSFQRIKPRDNSTYSSYSHLYPTTSRFDSPVRKQQQQRSGSQFLLHKRRMKNSSRAYSESNLLSIAQRRQKVEDLLEKKQREKKILENLQTSLNATLSAGRAPTSSISVRSDLYGSLVRPKAFALSKDRLFDKRFATMSANSSTSDFAQYRHLQSKDRLDKRLVVASDCTTSPDFSSLSRRLSRDRLDKRLIATADCSTPDFLLARRQSKDHLSSAVAFSNECKTPELSMKQRTRLFNSASKTRLYEGSNDALYSLYGELPLQEYSAAPVQNRTFPRRSKKGRRSTLYDGEGGLSVIEDACSKSSTSDGSCSMSMSNITDVCVKPFSKNKLSAMKTLSFTISKNEVIGCIESSL